MGIPADLYKKDLCDELHIKNLDEIGEEHSEKLLEYITEHKNKNALKDILTTLPDFISFVNNSINSMKEIVKEIMGFSKVEINVLQTVIIQQENLLKNNQLTEKQKDRIIELQFEYQKILKELLDHNHEQKKLIISGTITVAAMAIAITGYWVSKISGGKVKPEILEEAAQKLIDKA